MSSEIATAFVRIRPNTTGFKNEAESGIKGAFTGLAKVVGVAFGVEQLAKFTEGLVEGAQGAAQLQKSIEVINSNFGKAAKSVTAFGEGAAANFGISAASADAVSAKFGILFKNLGIGAPAAATMTLNLEKLAGALSSIKGTDPSGPLQAITLAMLGNVRSLKQLGVAVDPAAIKIAALKLGLIQTTKDALTPGVRAQAIYAIATAHLGDYLAQAKKHAGDLTNVQRKLSAEWGNAKDKLGAALLPAMTRLVTFLSNILPGAMSATGRAFGDLISIVKKGIDLVSPLFKPVIDEIGRFHKAIQVGGASGGIRQLATDFRKLTPAAKGFTIAVGLAAASLVSVAVAAAPITALTLAVVGGAIAFKELYTHSAKFRDIVGQVQQFIDSKLKPAFESFVKKVKPEFAKFYVTASTAFIAVKNIVVDVVRIISAIWSRFGDTIKKVVKDTLGIALNIVSADLDNIKNFFKFITDLIHGNWSKAWADLKAIVQTTLDQALSLVKSFGQTLEDFFGGIWTSIKLVTIEGLAQLTSLLAKVPTSFKVFGQTIGVKNPFGGITAGLQQEISGIKLDNLKKSLAAKESDVINALLGAIQPALAKAGSTAGDTIKKPITEKIKQGAKDGTEAGIKTGVKAGADAALQSAESSLNTLKSNLKQAIAKMKTDVRQAVEDAKSNLISIGGSLATSISDIMNEPLAQAGRRIQDSQDRLAVIFDAASAKLAAQAARIQRQQSVISASSDRLSLQNLRREVLLPGGRTLSANPKEALAQLQQLERLSAKTGNQSAVQQFIIQYRSALLQVASDKVGLKQAALDARRTAKETTLNLKSEKLKVQQDAADIASEAATRQINDLTTAFTRGSITLKSFNKKVAELLGKDHVSYKKAGALLGSAFALGFRDQVRGIAGQAAAITRGPQVPGTNGEDVKIIRPLRTLVNDQRAIERIRTSIANKQTGIQSKILKEAEKQSALLKSINSVQLGKTAKSITKNPGHDSKTAAALTGTTN